MNCPSLCNQPPGEKVGRQPVGGRDVRMKKVVDDGLETLGRVVHIEHRRLQPLERICSPELVEPRTDEGEERRGETTDKSAHRG